MGKKLYFMIEKSIKRSIMVLSDFLKKCHYYSFYYGFWSLAWWIGNYCKLSSWKKKAEIKKKDWQREYIEKNYEDIIQHYRNDSSVEKKTEVYDYYIWVFWAQGTDDMPALVRACYNNLLKRAKDTKVILLTKENLGLFLNLPVSVGNALEKGIIGYTHLSDIIRHSLLAQYGGMWIDATVWITSDVPVSMIKKTPFYSAKDSYRQSYWVSYLLGGSFLNESLFCFVRDMLIAFCEREKLWPDYLIQDFLIDYAFNHFPSVREAMLSCPNNNPKRSDLWIRMNKVFDTKEYMMISQDNWFFKLSYKSHLVTSINGNMSYYGAIVNGIL